MVLGSVAQPAVGLGRLRAEAQSCQDWQTSSGLFAGDTAESAWPAVTACLSALRKRFC